MDNNNHIHSTKLTFSVFNCFCLKDLGVLQAKDLALKILLDGNQVAQRQFHFSKIRKLANRENRVKIAYHRANCRPEYELNQNITTRINKRTNL